MLPTAHENLYQAIKSFIPDHRLIRDPLRTLTYGTDASMYRLIPQLVVITDTEDEVRRILTLARAHRTPVTFRAAGTSLSGQAVTDSVLLMLGDGWRGWRIEPDVSAISLQPAVIGAHANRYLAPYQKKIGPDPASINACQIGGIAANNASGMCCGTAQNSYNTLKSMRLILADGALVDTGDEASRQAFTQTHGALLNKLAELGRRARDNTALAERIRVKFKIKNTCGYSLNALVDFEDPFEIMQHLMIGSEGTLGFIAEVTYHTVIEHSHKASALLFFPDVKTACEAVTILKTQPVAAAELMDRASLRSVEDKPGMPDFLQDLSRTVAAVLVETRALDGASLQAQAEIIRQALAPIEMLFPAEFTDKPEEFGKLWAVRQGLFTSVGSVRETGSTVIIEDVAFPIQHLAEATVALQDLFEQHAYSEAILFGHALEGNLHFVITPNFGRAGEVERYKNFMDEICDLVVNRYDGSLKAEHGTGRNMAPFVEMEWGEQAYGLMREIKILFDPDNLLNPGVILNDDPLAHTKDIKTMQAVDPLVDKCIECGFCEPTCPSRAITLTPRHRIVGLREMARLEALGIEPLRHKTIQADYQYQGVDTCAVDSLCSLSCPVGIDTGKMTKKLRSQHISERAQRTAEWAAKHFAGVASAVRAGLTTADAAHAVLGTAAMSRLTRGMRALSGKRMPLWNPYMPRSAKPAALGRHNGGAGQDRVVYFPSCASRTMGPARGDPETAALPDKTVALLQKAGYEVMIPANCAPLCCGQPFESKGLPDQADAKLRELEQALLEVSHGGKDSIVFDTSPCAFRARTHQQADLKIYDITEFLHDHVLARLQIDKLPETVAIHPTCSNIKMSLQAKLKALAEACADKVIWPDKVNCCGWSGDRGFTNPELNASALRDLNPSLPAECSAGYSTSRTCEIGLSLHSGRYYRSIVYLLDRCSRAKTG